MSLCDIVPPAISTLLHNCNLQATGPATTAAVQTGADDAACLARSCNLQTYRINFGNVSQGHARNLLQLKQLLLVRKQCQPDTWIASKKLSCWTRQFFKATCLFEVWDTLQDYQPEHTIEGCTLHPWLCIISLTTAVCDGVMSGCCCCGC